MVDCNVRDSVAAALSTEGRSKICSKSAIMQKVSVVGKKQRVRLDRWGRAKEHILFPDADAQKSKAGFKGRLYEYR